jgi:hypothetical protein
LAVEWDGVDRKNERIRVLKTDEEGGESGKQGKCNDCARIVFGISCYSAEHVPIVVTDDLKEILHTTVG